MGRQPGKQPCQFDGCDKLNFAYGYCSGHAAQVRRGKPLTALRQPRPTPADGFSWCCTCNLFRPEEDFGWDIVRMEWKRSCRVCNAQRQREYFAANKIKVRRKVTLRNWGLTDAQYDALFDAQNHKCAICGAQARDGRALAIDHCHDSGRIRGLLCQDCNLGMGQFADDPELLEAAVRYLRAGGVVHDEALRIPDKSRETARAKDRDLARARRRGVSGA